ncbi:MAG: hypothetical protein ACC656_02170 [Candidatus Heimdallarchaeota archaeon]
MEHLNEYNIFKNLKTDWSLTIQDAEKIVKYIEGTNALIEDTIVIRDHELENFKILEIVLPNIDDQNISYSCIMLVNSNKIIVKIKIKDKINNYPAEELTWNVVRKDDDLTWLDTYSRVADVINYYLNFKEDYEILLKKMSNQINGMSNNYPRGKVEMKNGKIINYM